MPSAHDAASLNEIAANSAIASRAMVCEKLGRNDVDISCAHPPSFAFVFGGSFVLLFSYGILALCQVLRASGRRRRPRGSEDDAGFHVEVCRTGFQPVFGCASIVSRCSSARCTLAQLVEEPAQFRLWTAGR